MEVPKIIKTHWKLLLVIALIIFGVAWRLVPHIPNFAPIGAIALLGGMALGWRYAVWLPLGVMIISDIFLGFYSGIHWTWLGFLVIVAFAYSLKKLSVGWRIPVGALGASLIFFLVSNFGVWLASGMYSPTFAGLMESYIMGLPFLRATILSDLLFAGVLLGAHELITRRVQLRQISGEEGWSIIRV